jgi:hypothetical protein
MSEPAIYELLDSGTRRFRHFVNLWLQDMGLDDPIAVTHDGERIMVIGSRELGNPWARMRVFKIDPLIPAIYSERMVRGLAYEALAALYRDTSKGKYFALRLN